MAINPASSLINSEDGAQPEALHPRWPPVVRRLEPWERSANQAGRRIDALKTRCVRREPQPGGAVPSLGAARLRRERRRQAQAGLGGRQRRSLAFCKPGVRLRLAAGLAAVILALLAVLAPNRAVDPGRAAHLPPVEIAPTATSTLPARPPTSFSGTTGPSSVPAHPGGPAPTSPEVESAQSVRPSPPASSPTPSPTLSPAEAEATAWQGALGRAAATSYAIQTQYMRDYAATQTALPATVMALQTRMAATASAATATMQARYPTVTYSPP